MATGILAALAIVNDGWRESEPSYRRCPLRLPSLGVGPGSTRSGGVGWRSDPQRTVWPSAERSPHPGGGRYISLRYDLPADPPPPGEGKDGPQPKGTRPEFGSPLSHSAVVLRRESGGTSAARSLGLSAARGAQRSRNSPRRAGSLSIKFPTLRFRAKIMLGFAVVLGDFSAASMGFAYLGFERASPAGVDSYRRSVAGSGPRPQYRPRIDLLPSRWPAILWQQARKKTARRRWRREGGLKEAIDRLDERYHQPGPARADP